MGKNWTSSVVPGSHLRELEGQINRRSHHGEWQSEGNDWTSGLTPNTRQGCNFRWNGMLNNGIQGRTVTSSGIPGSDLRELEGEVNKRGATPSGRSEGNNWTSSGMTPGATASGNRGYTTFGRGNFRCNGEWKRGGMLDLSSGGRVEMLYKGVYGGYPRRSNTNVGVYNSSMGMVGGSNIEMFLYEPITATLLSRLPTSDFKFNHYKNV